MLPGERILIVESWVVPTAVTPPCCDDPTQWWLAFSGVDGLYERRCWDHFPYVSPSLANSVMLTSDYASAAAGFLAYTSLQTTHNASSNRASTVAQAWPVIGEVSEPAINGEPIGARPFLRRPHQLITVMIVNASGTGLLSLPDSQPAAAAAARGQQTASASLSAPGWDPSTMAWAAREGSLVAGIWDGSSSGASCRITGDTAQGSPRPPWQAYSPPANLYPTSALACFGGHNTTCDASAAACLSAAAVGYHNVSDPTVRRCARDWVLGSMTYSMPSAPTQPWWQIGTTALTAWWKPCASCGPGAALRATGTSSEQAQPCDESACRANLSAVLQRRVVAPWKVPLPGALRALAEADRFAAPWYRCRPAPRSAFLAGFPVCQAVCSAGARDRAALLPGASGLASRTWLMAWGGRRPRKAAEGVRCGSGTDALVQAEQVGTVRLRQAMRSAPSAAAWRRALALPQLHTATLRLTLAVPEGELMQVSRQQLLAELAGDAEALAGGAATTLCVVARCDECPPADDPVWLTSPGADRSRSTRARQHGPPPSPGRASPLRQLKVALRFSSPGSAACAGVEAPAQPSWLVDARDGGGADPVAFTGTGSNTSWARMQPAAAQLAAGLLQLSDAAVAPAAAVAAAAGASAWPAMHALTVWSAVADAASGRAMGAWLVWGEASTAFPAPSSSGPGSGADAPVSVAERCLGEAAPPWGASEAAVAGCSSLVPAPLSVGIAVVLAASLASGAWLVWRFGAAAVWCRSGGHHRGAVASSGSLLARWRRVHGRLAMWGTTQAVGSVARLVQMLGLAFNVAAVVAAGAPSLAAVPAAALALLAGAGAASAARLASRGWERNGSSPAAAEGSRWERPHEGQQQAAPSDVLRKRLALGPVDTGAVMLCAVADASRAWAAGHALAQADVAAARVAQLAAVPRLGTSLLRSATPGTLQAGGASPNSADEPCRRHASSLQPPRPPAAWVAARVAPALGSRALAQPLDGPALARRGAGVAPTAAQSAGGSCLSAKDTGAEPRGARAAQAALTVSLAPAMGEPSGAGASCDGWQGVRPLPSGTAAWTAAGVESPRTVDPSDPDLMELRSLASPTAVSESTGPSLGGAPIQHVPQPPARPAVAWGERRWPACCHPAAAVAADVLPDLLALGVAVARIVVLGFPAIALWMDSTLADQSLGGGPGSSLLVPAAEAAVATWAAHQLLAECAAPLAAVIVAAIAGLLSRLPARPQGAAGFSGTTS